MAYELHIERPGGSIPLVEWKSAVATVEKVRLCLSRPAITNPKTGEVIRLGHSDGLTEAYSQTDKKWYPTFYWSNGRIHFKPIDLPGKKSDYVWQTAITLASLLAAVICGDQGEIYDLNTGEVIAASDDAELEEPMPSKEEIKFVFEYGAAAEAAAIGLRLIFERHQVARSNCRLNGKLLPLDRLWPEANKTRHKGFELVGPDYDVSFGSVGSCRLDFLLVKSRGLPRIPWDEWAAQFFSDKQFVMAWITDSEYNYWQNADEPLLYTSVGKSYSHLPMKSNGLPYPMEQTVIDTSNNPGRCVFRNGYIEAVGSSMWLGELFWQLTGTDKSVLLTADWLDVSNPIPSVIKVRAADHCFLTDDGAVGELQRKLRVLLCGNGR